MTNDERAAIIERGVIHRARKRYREGNFENPFGDSHRAESILKRGMAEAYDMEIERLLRERICPTCGQPTRGDLDS